MRLPLPGPRYDQNNEAQTRAAIERELARLEPTPTTAISDPTGGTTVDTECRAAVAEILALLRQRGFIE